MKSFVAVVMLGLLGGCELGSKWTIDSPQFYPAALDFWQQGKTFLTASYHDGTVQSVGSDGRKSVNPFLLKPSDGRVSVLRLKVDEARNRLWLLDKKWVFIYSLPQPHLIRRIEIPELNATVPECLPDLALNQTGDAIVSNNRHPVLYRIDGRSFSMSAHPIVSKKGVKLESGFSALLSVGSDGVLIAGSAATGRLWELHLPSGSAREISLTARISGICALAENRGTRISYSDAGPRGRRVYASTGFHNTIVQIALSPNSEAGTVRQSGSIPIGGTPVGVVAFGEFLVVAKSQLEHHSNFGGKRNPELPFRLVVTRKSPSWSLNL